MSFSGGAASVVISSSRLAMGNRSGRGGDISFLESLPILGGVLLLVAFSLFAVLYCIDNGFRKNTHNFICFWKKNDQ